MCDVDVDNDSGADGESIRDSADHRGCARTGVAGCGCRVRVGDIGYFGREDVGDGEGTGGGSGTAVGDGDGVGENETLVYSVRGDAFLEMQNVHQNLKRRFPNAEVRAASLAEMAEGLKPHWDALPVVTQEIGDTWVMARSSDPLKVARYGRFQGCGRNGLSGERLRWAMRRDVALLRRVTLEAEHTLGRGHEDLAGL